METSVIPPSIDIPVLKWECPHCHRHEQAVVADKRGMQCEDCNAHYEVSATGTIRPIPYVTYAKFTTRRY